MCAGADLRKRPTEPRCADLGRTLDSSRRCAVTTFPGAGKGTDQLEGGREGVQNQDQIFRRTNHGEYREGGAPNRVHSHRRQNGHAIPPPPLELTNLVTEAPTESTLVPRGRRAVLTGDLASRSGITRGITRGGTMVA